jgi:hypothetical protein
MQKNPTGGLHLLKNTGPSKYFWQFSSKTCGSTRLSANNRSTGGYQKPESFSNG